MSSSNRKDSGGAMGFFGKLFSSTNSKEQKRQQDLADIQAMAAEIKRKKPDDDSVVSDDDVGISFEEDAAPPTKKQ